MTVGTGDCSASTGQDIECSLDLVAGASAEITVDYEVAADVEAQVVDNTATAETTYTDDATNSTDLEAEGADSVEIVTDIDLSVVKTFAPDEVTEGTPQFFTIEVANAGPSDAVDVAVTDVVDGLLGVEGVALTSGVGDCGASIGQDVECTVQIPAGESVVVTVDYLVELALGTTPAHGTTDGSEFRIVFDNGSVLEGSASGAVTLTAPDGVVTPLADGTSRHDYVFDPPGDDPPFTLHLSCSEAFVGGWGEAGGPVEGVDANWQIDYYSITRYKKGEYFRSCADLVAPLQVLNVAAALGVDSGGEVTAEGQATVAIAPQVTVDQARARGKGVVVGLTNNGGAEREIVDISIDWPAANGNLIRIRLGDTTVWSGRTGASPAAVSTLIPGWPGTTLGPGDTQLRFDFKKKVVATGATIIVTFADGSTVGVTL